MCWHHVDIFDIYSKQTHDYFHYNKKIKLLWYFIILFHLNTIHGNIIICNNFKGKFRNRSENNMKYLIFILSMVACKNKKITFFWIFQCCLIGLQHLSCMD
jgi:hypothetical protein